MARASLSEILGSNVKRLRARRRLSQRDLADLVAMDRADVSRLESGRANPTVDRLESLAVALNVEPPSLLRP